MNSTQCFGTYCGNVQKIRGNEKLMLCTYYMSLATIISNNPFWQRKCKCWSVSRVNVSAPMVTSSMAFCCYTSEHMILSSENKCFCNVSARLYFVGLPPIFEEPACKKKQFFWGLAIFLIICSLQPWHLNNSGEFSSGSS